MDGKSPRSCKTGAGVNFSANARFGSSGAGDSSGTVRALDSTIVSTGSKAPREARCGSEDFCAGAVNANGGPLSPDRGEACGFRGIDKKFPGITFVEGPAPGNISQLAGAWPGSLAFTLMAGWKGTASAKGRLSGAGAGITMPVIKAFTVCCFGSSSGSGLDFSSKESTSASVDPKVWNVAAPAGRHWGGADPGIAVAASGGAASSNASRAKSGTEAGAEMFTPGAVAELRPNNLNSSIQQVRYRQRDKKMPTWPVVTRICRAVQPRSALLIADVLVFLNFFPPRISACRLHTSPRNYGRIDWRRSQRPAGAHGIARYAG